MLYQLSYARAPHEWWGKDSNLRRREAGRFTVCSLWPLGHPTRPVAPRIAVAAPSPPTDKAPRSFAWSRGAPNCHHKSTLGLALYLIGAQELSQPGGKS